MRLCDGDVFKVEILNGSVLEASTDLQVIMISVMKPEQKRQNLSFQDKTYLKVLVFVEFHPSFAPCFNNNNVKVQSDKERESKNKQ